jgi:hypothetical protein
MALRIRIFIRTIIRIFIRGTIMPATFLYLILLVGLLDPLPETQQPKQLRYHLYSKNEKVGEIIARKTVSGNTVRYETSTTMTIRIVFKQDFDYRVVTTFRDGALLESIGNSNLNKKPHSSCKTQWTRGKYEIIKDEGLLEINRQITYTGSMLYFQEPPVSGTVFSELNGHENKIRVIASHQYLLTDARTKKENRYYYKNGILETANIDHALVSLELRRVH